MSDELSDGFEEGPDPKAVTTEESAKGEETEQNSEEKTEDAPAAPPRFEELPERFALPDGTIVSREDLADLASDFPNAKKWRSDLAERGKKLNDAQAALQQYQWGVQVQNIAATDPVFAAEISQAYARRYGGGGQAQPQTSELKPLDQFKDDEVVQEAIRISKQAQEQDRRWLQEQLQQQVGPMIGRLQQQEQYLGQIAGREALAQVEGAFKKHGITPTQDLLNHVQDIAVRRNIPIYDPNGDVDAFRSVAWEQTASRVKTNGTARSAAKPNATLPDRGSSNPSRTGSAETNLPPEFRPGYGAWRVGHPKGTPEQFMKFAFPNGMVKG